MDDQTSSNQRYPDLGKLSIAILENLVKPVIGEKAINEVKAPVVEKELRDSIYKALRNTEKRLFLEYSNIEFHQALLSLPVIDLPSTLDGARALYSSPTDSTLAKFLKQRLSADFPHLPADIIDTGITCYIDILRQELSSISDEVRGKLLTLATMSLESNVAQIARSVDRILDYLLSIKADEEIEISKVAKSNYFRMKKKNVDPDSWHFETGEKVIAIGRAPDNDVVLDDPDISWYHGYIERITGIYRYHHLSTTNPSVIRRQNQEFLLSRRRLSEILLQNNDRIVVGKNTLVVEFDIVARPPGYITTEKNRNEE